MGITPPRSQGPSTSKANTPEEKQHRLDCLEGLRKDEGLREALVWTYNNLTGDNKQPTMEDCEVVLDYWVGKPSFIVNRAMEIMKDYHGLLGKVLAVSLALEMASALKGAMQAEGLEEN